MKYVLISRIRKTFRLSDLEIEMSLNEEDELCNHWAECQKRCFASKPCRIKEFHERYPNYEFLGIGAATEAPGARYT